MSKIKFFLDYFKFLKNPISCLLFKFGFKKSVIARFKSNYSINIDDVKILDRIMLEYTIYDSKEFLKYYEEMCTNNSVITLLNDIKIYNPKFNHLNDIFLEYYTDYYANFNINYKNKIIVDIGANAADTALFFASLGAKVYGFEPVKSYYEMGLKNIKLNPKLSNNIKMFNYGVSYKKGSITIDAMNSTSDYRESEDKYDVEVISMDDILNRIQPDLLKMDCEGCEAPIILNSDLSSFSEVIFEHHAGYTGVPYKKLVEKLKSEGFNHIEMSKVGNFDLDYISLIYANK